MTEKFKLVLGGVEHTLVKTPRRFHVLNPSPDLVSRLRRDKDVVGLNVEHGRGLARIVARDAAGVDRLLTEVRNETVAHHEYVFDSDEALHRFIPTGRIRVRVKDPGSRAIDEIAGRYSLERSPDPAFGGYSRMELTDESPMNPVRLCRELLSDPGITYAEPDYLFYTEPCSPPAWLDRQWHLRDAEGGGAPSPRGVDVAGAWEVTCGSPEIVIAIIDDGFDTSVEDLKTGIVDPADFAPYSGAAALPEPFVPASAEPLPGGGNYHGTPCAGLAVARGASLVSGVAPGCSWMPVRVAFGLNSEDYWLRVFEFVSRRADVASCSFAVLPSPFENLSSTMLDAMSDIVRRGGRRGRGLVLCFAAGNYNLPTSSPADDNPGLEYFDPQGRKLGTFFRKKAVYSKWCQVPGALVVASCSAARTKSLYSNWGPDITVCAPSDDWRVDVPPEERRSGPRLVTTDNDKHGRGLFDVGIAREELGPVTDAMGGTSGATPQVAGLCGLILSARPTLSAMEVKEVVCLTADRSSVAENLGVAVAPANNAGQSGAFDEGGHSAWYGHGVISPARAIRSLIPIEGDDVAPDHP